MKTKIDRLIEGISTEVRDSLCVLLEAYKEGQTSKETFWEDFRASAERKISMTLNAIDVWKNESKAENKMKDTGAEKFGCYFGISENDEPHKECKCGVHCKKIYRASPGDCYYWKKKNSSS